MVQKFYAIKNEKAIRTGTIISTVFAVVVSGGCYFLGGFGRLFDDPSVRSADGAVVYDAIVPFMLSKLPDILIGIVIILVLSASMSTLSSLVLTSSSTMTLDLLKGNVFKKMSEKKQIVTMQILIVFFIVISVVLGPEPAYLYRTADGNFLGRFGRSFSGSISVWDLLERCYQIRCLGQFHLRRGNHRFQYVFEIHRLADQCRRNRYGGRTGDCSDCQPW